MNIKAYKVLWEKKKLSEVEKVIKSYLERFMYLFLTDEAKIKALESRVTKFVFDAGGDIEKLKELTGYEPEAKIEKTRYILNGKLYETIIVDNGVVFCSLDNDKVEFRRRLKDGSKVIKPRMGDEIGKAVFLPNGIEPYQSELVLVSEIKSFIKRYCDIPKLEGIDVYDLIAYYILISWIYDRLPCVPYLRTLGDFGTGKSRFLEVVGKLCYKPITASGVVTSAALFRMVDTWGGTFIVDEADMKDTSLRSEIITVLNCGFEKGKPVIRCNKRDPKKLEFYDAYGPKVISSRHEFSDKALESRCITFVSLQTNKQTIPTNLDENYYVARRKLIRKLLYFRLKNYNKIKPVTEVKLGVEPRLKQVLSSFLSLTQIHGLKETIEKFAMKYQSMLVEQRSETIEGLTVRSILDLLSYGIESITPTRIKDRITERFGMDVSVNYLGRLLRSLGLKTIRKKVEGKLKRCLIIDTKMLRMLAIKYIPPDELQGYDMEWLSTQKKLTELSKPETVEEEKLYSVHELKEMLIKELENTESVNILDFINKFSELHHPIIFNLINKLKEQGVIYEIRNGVIALLK